MGRNADDDYHRQNQVDTRIARIFNTYGPRIAESDGRVVSNFIVQALRGDPLTLYGNGEQTSSASGSIGQSGARSERHSCRMRLALACYKQVVGKVRRARRICPRR